MKETFLGNPESGTSVHLVHGSGGKQANGSTGQQVCDTVVSTGNGKSRCLEDIDNWSASNPSGNPSRRQEKASVQLNRSYSTACTTTTTTSGTSSGLQSGSQTPRESSSKRKKRRGLTSLKLSLSGGRLASPSNLSDLILGSESDKALLDDADGSNADQLTNQLSAKTLSQKRKLYGRSATAYSGYRYSPNRSLSIDDAEDQELAQSLIDKPILFDEEPDRSPKPYSPGQYSDSVKTADHLQTDHLKSEHRTRTASGGSHQLATNFNNRKARYQQPFGRQLSTGGLLTGATYSAAGGGSSKQRGSSPSSSSQFLASFQARTSQPSKQSAKKPFLSQSTIDTSRLVDPESLVIDDFISPEVRNLKDTNESAGTGKLASVGRKSTLQSGDSSESANQVRVSQPSGSKPTKASGGPDELADAFELRNMSTKGSKLITATSLGSSTGAGAESRTSAAGSGSPISTPINSRPPRPTTFTALNMPPSSPGSPKEHTNLMRQFSDRDEISLYGTPKEEMPHSGFMHGDSRTANFMRNQIEALFQPSDNKLAMKLFGSKKALMKERERQKESGLWIIHPCSNFRFYWDLCM